MSLRREVRYDRMQMYFILVTVALPGMVASERNTPTISQTNITVVNRNMMTNRDHQVSTEYVDCLVGRPIQLKCHTRPARGDRIKLVLWFKNNNLLPIYSFDMRSTSQSSGVHWQDVKVLQDRATFHLDKSPASLVITRSTVEDQGMYRCRVDFNTAPTRISEINVTVVVPPQKPVIRRASIETGQNTKDQHLDKYKDGDILGQYKDGDILGPYKEGDNMRLNCTVSGGIPSPALTWWKNNTIIDNSFDRRSDQVSNLLELRNLTRNDLNQRLTCTAANVNNSASGNPGNIGNTGNIVNTANIVNTGNIVNPGNIGNTGNIVSNPNSVSTFVNIDMVLPPLYVNLLNDQPSLKAGIKHTFTCEVLGSRPPPVISWTLKSSTLKQSDIQRRSPDGTLMSGFFSLVPTKLDNGRNLSCHVQTPGLQQTTTTSRTLSVRYVPDVKLRFGRETNGFKVVEGENVSLVCEVDANPEPHNIVWMKNSSTIQFGAGITAIGHHLLLEEVGRRLNGAYTCSAVNSEGRQVSNILMLEVKSRPYCVSSHKVHEVSLNESVEVTCSVESNAGVVEQVHWTFRNNHTKYKLKGNPAVPSRIVYTPRSIEDFGYLLCWGENQLGKQENPCIAQILPDGGPDAGVSNCVKQNVTYSSFEIICPSSSLLHGIHGPIFAVVSKAGTGEVVWSSQSQSGKFVVSDLSPATNYRIFLVSYSEDGLPHKVHLELTTVSNSTSPAPSWSPGLALFLPLSVIVGIVLCGVAAICGITFLACTQNRKKNKKYGAQSDLAAKNLDLLAASQQQSLLHCSGPGDGPPSPSLTVPFPALPSNPGHQFYSSSSLHRPPSYSTVDTVHGHATIRSCSSPPLSMPLLHVHVSPMPSFQVPVRSPRRSMHGSQDVASMPPYPRRSMLGSQDVASLPPYPRRSMHGSQDVASLLPYPMSDNDLNSEDNTSLSSYSTPVRRLPPPGPSRRVVGAYKTFQPARYHSGNLRNPSSGLRMARRVPRYNAVNSHGGARGHSSYTKVGQFDGGGGGGGGAGYSTAYGAYLPSVSDGGYSSNDGGHSSTYGGGSGTDRRYPGVDGDYSGADRRYPGVDGDYSGADRRYSGPDGGYPGADRRFTGTDGEYSGSDRRYPRPDGGYLGADGRYSGTDRRFSGTDGGYSGTDGGCSGTDGGYSGTEGCNSGTDEGNSTQIYTYFTKCDTNINDNNTPKQH